MQVTGSVGISSALRSALKNLRDAVVARRGNGNDVAGTQPRYGGRQGSWQPLVTIMSRVRLRRINGQPSDVHAMPIRLNVRWSASCAGHYWRRLIRAIVSASGLRVGRGYIPAAQPTENGTGT